MPYLHPAGRRDRHGTVAEVRAGPVPPRGRSGRTGVVPIPTAEVPLTNIVRDRILELAESAAATRRTYALFSARRPAATARTRAA